MIPRSHNPFSIIILVQFFAIIAGTLLTTGMLKLHGYPDADCFIWNPASEFIRNWGCLVLPLPIALLLLAYRPWRTDETGDLSTGFVALSIAVTLALLLFYSWTSMTAATFSNKAYLSKTRHATTTSRSDSMIFPNFTINPVCVFRPRW